MKKYGKYEKRPEKVAVKQPKVKNVLLQTYFTSLLSLVLCMSMFLGTSYAWFTSEVNNTANEIYIGVLDADLRLKQTDTEGNIEWTSLKRENAPKIFTEDVKWEPGYTAVETLQVVNQGDLTFDYELKFISGDETLDANVADLFEVYVCKSESKADDIEGIKKSVEENSGWEYKGTLKEVLTKGTSVFEGTMVTVGKEIPTETTAAVENAETTEATEATATTPKWNENGTDSYIIAMHMKKDATAEVDGASIMGKKLTLNVKLIAYQRGGDQSESDGFGNANYDDAAFVSNAQNLAVSLNKGCDVELMSNIEIMSADARVTMNGGILNGNGNTIRYTATKGEDEPSLGVVTTTGGTVKNLIIDGRTAGRALYITELKSNLEVNNCVLSGVYAFNLNSATKTEFTINFTKTTFKDWTSYDNVVSCASFTDCTFDDILRPYGDTTLTNCKFTKAGLDVSKLEKDETVTLINCTYNDEPVEKAVLTSDGEVVVVAKSNVIKVDADKMVVLSDNG